MITVTHLGAIVEGTRNDSLLGEKGQLKKLGNDFLLGAEPGGKHAKNKNCLGQTLVRNHAGEKNSKN